MAVWVAAEMETLMWTYSRQWDHLANSLINMILLMLAVELHGQSTMLWNFKSKALKYEKTEKYKCDFF